MKCMTWAISLAMVTALHVLPEPAVTSPVARVDGREAVVNTRVFESLRVRGREAVVAGTRPCTHRYTKCIDGLRFTGMNY